VASGVRVAVKRRGRRLAASLIVLVAVIAAFLAANAGATSTQKASGSKSTVWRYGFADDIDYNANVFHSFNSTPYQIFDEVYDLLLNYDHNGNPDLQHSLATSFDVSADHLTYTYHLRHGVRWADGVPLTAQDVKFSYDQAPNSLVNSGEVSTVSKTVIVDPYTVKVILSSPDVRTPSAFVPIVPMHIWSHHIKDLTSWRPIPMIGTGPYYVSSMNEKGVTVLLPNPYFYGPKGPIKKMLLIHYDNQDSELTDLQLNRLDAVQNANLFWKQSVLRNPSLHWWPAPQPGFVELAFNSCPTTGSNTDCPKGPAAGVHIAVVQDPAIRHAIAWDIDRNNLSRTVWNGVAQPANSPISPYFAGRGDYHDFSTDPVVGYGYDPAKAKQILAQGGWQCPAGGICTKNGVRAEFTLDAVSDNPDYGHAARRIVAWLRNIGIQADLQLVPSQAENNKIYTANSPPWRPREDAFVWDWGGDIATPDYNLQVLQCGNTSEDAMYCNKAFDKYANAAIGDLNPAKRIADLTAAQRILLQDLPYIYLSYKPDVWITRTDTWKGYQAWPVGGVPSGYSWVQNQILTAGAAASTSYTGAPVAMAILVGGLVLAVVVTRYRRRAEESGPLEEGEEA
jgi:peptide/nickel transport system substrate-binding protein